MTVYVVTCGEYSDYGIHSIHSTRELATEEIKRVIGPDKKTWDIWSWAIEEYAVDAPAQLRGVMK